MDISLKFGSLDVHNRVSTYSVQKEITYPKVVTTMDGTEHAARSKDRYVVSVSLFPMTESETAAVYQALLDSVISVTFTDPYSHSSIIRPMRVTSNLDSAFALLSVDGQRRYKGGAIQLRET